MSREGGKKGERGRKKEWVSMHVCSWEVRISYSDWQSTCSLSSPFTTAPSFSTALLSSCSMSSDSSFSNTITLHLLRRAEFNWKEGFSVVAPSNVMVPSST